MLSVNKITDTAERESVFLANDLIRTVINNRSGMIPELSFKCRDGYVNTHWNPHFRGNGVPYNPERHKTHWGGRFLYDIAGNFPCIPGFGLPSNIDGYEIPMHGHTSNLLWKSVKNGTIEDTAVYSETRMEIPDSLPLSYKKYDILLKDHPVHYSVIKIKNNGNKDYYINTAWHNTIGSPFLQQGCIIDLSADRFITHPGDSEFVKIGSLALGEEFDDLEKVPLRNGKSTDIRIVPGLTGHTDFISGAVPKNADIGWSSVVNPVYSAVYLCFFKGPAAVSENEVPLNFNDLWMQYGGRNYTPWAARDGGTDLAFCLGTENATAAYANGLENSINNPELMGNPTTVKVKKGEEKVLYYATAAFTHDEEELNGGIGGIEQDGKFLLVSAKSGNGNFSINADPAFESVKKIIDQIDR